MLTGALFAVSPGRQDRRRKTPRARTSGRSRRPRRIARRAAGGCHRAFGHAPARCCCRLIATWKCRRSLQRLACRSGSSRDRGPLENPARLFRATTPTVPGCREDRRFRRRGAPGTVREIANHPWAARKCHVTRAHSGSPRESMAHYDCLAWQDKYKRGSQSLDLMIRLLHYNGNMKKSAVVAALGALAQETRLDIFRLLVQRGPEGLAAGEIAERLHLPSATLSFHLAQLKHAGLATARRESRSIIYSADFTTTAALVSYLTENCCRGRPDLCLPSVVRPRHHQPAHGDRASRQRTAGGVN